MDKVNIDVLFLKLENLENDTGSLFKSVTVNQTWCKIVDLNTLNEMCSSNTNEILISFGQQKYKLHTCSDTRKFSTPNSSIHLLAGAKVCFGKLHCMICIYDDINHDIVAGFANFRSL